MRTTITLPDELHHLLLSAAHSSRQTLSETITQLLRRGLSGPRREGEFPRIYRSPRTGLPVVDLGPGHIVTTEDVRSLDDEE